MPRSTRHYSMILDLINEGAYTVETAEAEIKDLAQYGELYRSEIELLATWSLNARHAADIRTRKRQGGEWGIGLLEVGDYVLTSGGETGRIVEIAPLDFDGRRYEIKCEGMNVEDFSLFPRGTDLVRLFPLEG